MSNLYKENPVIGAVICEFNPFHKGHKFLLDSMRKMGVTHIICLMSGCFVQRGEPAVTLPSLRAEAALENGADLCLEMPIGISISPAREFAGGAVRILKSLNCVNYLGFGTESDPSDFLKRARMILNLSKKYAPYVQNLKKQGLSSPKALYETILKYADFETAEFLKGGNNILGLEYIKAVEGSQILPMVIKRQGEMHDSLEINDSKLVSSSLIRKLLYENNFETGLEYIPKFSNKQKIEPNNILDKNYFERLILFKLRFSQLEDFENIPFIGKSGLANKMYSKRNAANLDEFLDSVKSKNVTMAAIKRNIVYLALGIRESDIKSEPQFARILGMNEKGREILNIIQAKNGLKVNSSLAKLEKLSDTAKRLANLENMAYNFYTLCLPEKKCGGYGYKQNIIIKR